ncbi:hypothetical protein [Sphingomonas sp.]|uniref:hypothetical protein n=1 Tax=Sphingomonas sp. TaxID=28214 RepID=UPI002DD62364|nr:hypothetical protein [Sphingomonas sp.]
MMADTQTTAAKANRRAKLASARDTAFERAKTTVSGLESNPVGVLVGGLAFGLIAGALIPRSEREKDMLKPVGKRLAEGAGAALAAAKETGKEQLSASMLSRDAAREGARKIFDSALTAAKEKGASNKTTA